MKLLCPPHLDQLSLMQFGPLPDELAALFRQTTVDQIQVFKLHHRLMFTVFDVKMRRRMFTIDQIHPDDDPIEAADFGHQRVEYLRDQ